MIPLELIMGALSGSPQPPGGLPQPKGRFPSEIAGKKYDPMTGNLIREPGPMDASLPRPGPARVTEIGGDPSGRPSPPSSFDEEFADFDKQGTAGMPDAPPKPLKGYRISFGGQSFDIDPASVAQRQRDRIRMAFDPLDAGGPQQRAAAQQARAAAEKYIGIVPPRVAIKVGMDVYQQEMDRDAAHERAKFGGARGPAVVGGFDKNDVLRQGSAFDDVEQYLKNYQQSESLIRARTVIDDGLKVQEMLKANNSMADWAAQKEFLKSYLKGAVSDYDSKDFKASAGKLLQYEQEFNAWFNGGEAPPDLKRKLADAVLIAESYYRKKIERIGAEARANFEDYALLTGRMTPQEAARTADMIQSRITGRRVRTGGGGVGAAPAGKGAPGKPAPKEAAAPGGGDKKKRAEEIMGRLKR